MEKPSASNLKNKIMSCLPKASSPFTFQLSPPASPVKATARKGFNGPSISIIPKEVRRKPKTESFVAQEPTSPKVSCMGQVKNKRKNSDPTKPMLVVPPLQENAIISSPTESKKKPLSMVNNFLKGKKQGGQVKISDNKKPIDGERVPSLGQMKQYAGSRGSMLANFDWTACEEESKVVSVGGEVSMGPRKQVNLWKRRNRGPPIPLQV